MIVPAGPKNGSMHTNGLPGCDNIWRWRSSGEASSEMLGGERLEELDAAAHVLRRIRERLASEVQHVVRADPQRGDEGAALRHDLDADITERELLHGS